MAGERLKIREDILNKVTSPEAERVSRQLGTIYLRLLQTPEHLWEGENVLRLTGETREGQRLSAWNQLIALVRVSPRTLKKVLAWLATEGVIEYYTNHDRSEIVIAFEGLVSRGSDR